MCGIAGLFNFRSHLPVEREALEHMGAALQHRGPDQSGVFVDADVGLSHRRLSIIDLSEAARQPMTNEDGSVILTFNGEIYNFIQLREELRAAGHVFRSMSDTEVIVHLWEDRGTALLERLVGMFAFALFDRKTRELVIARDRLGEKPLFWADLPDGIAFASEIKAVATDARVSLELDRDGLAEYVARQYVPAPRTVYRGVRALEPGSFVVFRHGREPKTERYWAPRPRRDLPASRRERLALVEEELDRSVRACMIADVPVGCFLSSGIDSSLVADAMRRQSTGPVETFSIGFHERGYDESEGSTRLAAMLGVKHHVEILDAPTFGEIERILHGYDQPFGDSTAIPTYLLSRVARQRVKVVLSGDGGDEAFGGYERYRMMRVASSLPRLAGLRRLGTSLSRSGAPSMSAGRILGRALVVAASARVDAYASLMAPFAPGTEGAVLGDAATVRFSTEERCFDGIDDVTVAAQVADLTTYLPSCLTTKVDIASMAHSLEVRAPYLDHRLVELGLGLPKSDRVRMFRTKDLLRDVARRRVGREIAWRKKRGFGVPMEVWLAGPMRAEAQEYLLGASARIRTVINPALVEYETERFFAGEKARYFRVWPLLALEAWLRSPLGRRAVP
jgi:asparagine synthase (glutamine-hydrolysing)